MKGGRIRRQTQRPIDTVGNWRKEGRDNSNAILITKLKGMCYALKFISRLCFYLTKAMGKATERNTREPYL